MNDPIADLLTIIRNGNERMHKKVEIPFSKLKLNILKVLLKEGFIKKLQEQPEKRIIEVFLKYLNKKEKVIKKLKRISKPSLRIYAKKDNLPKVLNGLGIALISTSLGILTDQQARKKNIGGEVLAYIW